MRVYVFKGKTFIAETGAVMDGTLEISVNGVPDGEEITLYFPNGKYKVQSLKDGKVVYTIGEDDHGVKLRISIKDADQQFFLVKNGAVYHMYDNTQEELNRLYGVIADIACELEAANAKISKLTDGFMTE